MAAVAGRARARFAAPGFDFVETMGGIRFGERPFARRLIGWGARNRLEALADRGARAAADRTQVADTRLTIHPPDMRSAICRRSIARSLGTLLPRMRAESYGAFLRGTAI